jgi:RND family efflux transporter MFP subunit
MSVAAIFVAVARKLPDVAASARGSGAAHRNARQVLSLDDRRQQLAGIRTATVTRGAISPALTGTGVVSFDETRFTDINLKLDGWIRDLFVNYTGQDVVKGQPLFTLFSQELVGAQLQYLAALRSRQGLTAAQASDRDYQEKLIETPRRRLLYWDVPLDQIDALEKAGEALEAVTFRSPANGTVIEKMVAKGMHVESGATLYRLADTSVMWIDGRFSVTDGAKISRGQQATIAFGRQPAERFAGSIVHVYPALVEPSKATRVRIELPNRAGLLKAGMFATIDVTLAPENGLIVPDDAIIDSGQQRTVFVATGQGRFEPRTVRVGLRDRNQAIVLSGVNEGEKVVTRAAFLLDSESQLRAAFANYADVASPKRPSTMASEPTINLTTAPDPAHVGTNRVRVELRDAQQRPITDASVTVRFSMPAMPSMNMPAMHADARLQHQADGAYIGTSSLSMAGSWEVTVSAQRDGRMIAEKELAILVR